LLLFVLILCSQERFQLTQISLKVLITIKKTANETISQIQRLKMLGLTASKSLPDDRKTKEHILQKQKLTSETLLRDRMAIEHI